MTPRPRWHRRRPASLSIAVATALLVTTMACTSDDDSDRSAPEPTGPTGDAAGFTDAAWMRERQDEYLREATAELDRTSPLSVLAHLERAARDDDFDFGADRLQPDDFAASFDKLDGFADTSDFDLLYLMNLWYAQRDRLSDTMVEAIEQRILAFKYWYTEPTPDGVIDQKWYWSENHRLIFHTLELLAGQAFPDATFTNDGRTGAEHADHARTLLDDWFDEHARYGFSEWHSDVYYQKDVTPLLTLVEFVDDEALATKAAAMLDLVLLDMASKNQRGNFGATHGRSYMKDKSIATDQNVFGITKLLFDDTDLAYPAGADPGATLLARAAKYRLPEVIRRIAVHDEPMVDRERMGVPLDALEPVTDDPEPPYGIAYDDPDNVPFWFERGALTVWQVVPLTLDTAEAHDLWETDFFKPFLPFRPEDTGDYSGLQGVARDFAPQLASGLLSEVNTYTWRGRDAMLSTAQDHRAGMRANQYHAWQATLDGEALVFTTHPANEPDRDDEWLDGDMYWTGTASMPRSAQQGRAAIHLYAPAYGGEEGPIPGSGYLPMTHAWFPTERFDQVEQDGHWTFGRKGDGYVALWSWRDVEWRDHDPNEVMTGGLTERFDLIAPGGADNVWIVEVGEASEHETFDAFKQAITEAEPEVTARPPSDDGLPGGFDVTYRSPSEGTMTFGSTDDLTVDGDAVALGDYPRMDNPFVEVPHQGREVEVADGTWKLTIDTERWTRTVDG